MKAFAVQVVLAVMVFTVSLPLFHVSAVEASEINAESTSSVPAGVSPDEPSVSARDMAEFHATYRLGDADVFKLVMAQRPRARHAWAASEFGSRNISRRPLPEAVYFRWVDSKLAVARVIRGESTLRKLVTTPLGLALCQVGGDERLLDRIVPADIIWKPGTPAGKLAESMNASFAREFRLPVKLTLGTAEMEVFVARGQYEYAKSPVARDVSKADPIVIAADDAAEAVATGLDGRGGLGGALAALGDVVGLPVVSEATAAPAEGLAWYCGKAAATPEEVEKIAAAVSSQTGLTFTREKRTVPRLLVEKGLR